MILISESCCGRQRASLKLELRSTAGYVYRRIRISVNKAGVFRFSFTGIFQMQHFKAGGLL